MESGWEYLLYLLSWLSFFCCCLGWLRLWYCPCVCLWFFLLLVHLRTCSPCLLLFSGRLSSPSSFVFLVSSSLCCCFLILSTVFFIISSCDFTSPYFAFLYSNVMLLSIFRLSFSFPTLLVAGMKVSLVKY